MAYVILFYNKFFGSFPEVTHFDSVPGVVFTTDRQRLREADAVVFHLAGAADIQDAVKFPHQLWIGWSLESRIRTPIRSKTRAMRAFDLHMGFNRQDDVWAPYLAPWRQWQAALAEPRQAFTEPTPAVLFQSAPSDQAGRDAYLTELMQHLKFDSYGRFLRNRDLPAEDRGIETKLGILRRYRFTLAFENSIEDDYVTEKFFQPLMIGSVPVYRGAPNIDDFAPGDHCFIDAGRYSPGELAAKLTDLSNNEEQYARYHEWRKRPLRPGFMKLLDDSRINNFERLAMQVKQRLDERGAAPAGKPYRPFGWRGYADSKWRPVRQALRRARKTLRLTRPR